MNALQPRNLDDLLRSYFRAEMPDPWPALEAPAPPAVLAMPRRPRAWWRRAGRLALAASVAFLLIGYLALASLFPSETSKGLNLTGPSIGQQGHPPKKADSLQKQRSSALPLQPGLKLPAGFKEIHEDRLDPKTVVISGRE